MSRSINRQLPKTKEELISQFTRRCIELLHLRGNLSRDDLEYTVETISKLKDERLKSCVATLIGWGDEERAEIETMLAVGLEVMRLSNTSKLREATLRVSLKHYTKALRNDQETNPPIDSARSD